MSRRTPRSTQSSSSAASEVYKRQVQASPRGGRVTLRHRRQGGRCLIEVSDQGPGIPPDARARIFEPFFTTKDRGTGLGLAISQRIIAAHQGEIRIPSREGGGTTVE